MDIAHIAIYAFLVVVVAPLFAGAVIAGIWAWRKYRTDHSHGHHVHGSDDHGGGSKSFDWTAPIKLVIGVGVAIILVIAMIAWPGRYSWNELWHPGMNAARAREAHASALTPSEPPPPRMVVTEVPAIPPGDTVRIPGVNEPEDSKPVAVPIGFTVCYNLNPERDGYVRKWHDRRFADLNDEHWAPVPDSGLPDNENGERFHSLGEPMDMKYWYVPVGAGCV